jgi:hypothetical protein
VLATLIILGLIVIAIFGGGLYWLLQRQGSSSLASASALPAAAIPPQQLSALAQPYRNLLGEAVSIQQEVVLRSRVAPPSLRSELAELSQRMSRLVLQALPLAEHGTQLSEYLLQLRDDDAEQAATLAEAAELQGKLEQFLQQLKRIRGKVYAILSSAANLRADPQLERELADALADVADLDSALSETVRDMRFLP